MLIGRVINENKNKQTNDQDLNFKLDSCKTEALGVDWLEQVQT